MEGDILDDHSVEGRVRRLLKKYRAEHVAHRDLATQWLREGKTVDWTEVSLCRQIVASLEWALGEGDQPDGAYPYLQECDPEAT